jgi:hypothetical protein
MKPAKLPRRLTVFENVQTFTAERRFDLYSGGKILRSGVIVRAVNAEVVELSFDDLPDRFAFFELNALKYDAFNGTGFVFSPAVHEPEELTE